MRRLARLEHLIERRPELLSSVMLRQNPHAVHEWHKRVKLFTGNPTKQILTYTEAVKTVDPDKVGVDSLLHGITSRFCVEATAANPFELWRPAGSGVVTL